MNKKTGLTKNNILVGFLIAIAIVVAVAAVVMLDTTGKKGSGLSREYLYDLKTLGKIDPNLILYEQSPNPIITGLKASRAIAVDFDGMIYIAGDNAVSRIDTDGINKLISLAEMPGCLAVAKDGTIYVGLKDHIEIYDAKGGQIAKWDSLSEKAILTSIAVSENNVFVADAGNRIVLRYDTGGKLINKIGKPDPDKNIPGFLIPSPYFDIAVAGDGLLRAVNPGMCRIEAYTFEGDLEFWWGKSSADIKGFCGCCNPVNFAILDDDSFVTCEKGLVRVKIYDSEGNFIGVVAGPEILDKNGSWIPCASPSECQTRGYDIAVDKKGRIFVLDTVRDIVRIFTKIKSE